jgi:hypothetical protein
MWATYVDMAKCADGHLLVIGTITPKMQGDLFLLKNDCKKYFNTRGWPIFGSNAQVKNAWQSLLKSVLKSCGYQITAMTPCNARSTMGTGLYIQKIPSDMAI